ncbi:alpha crystallin/HSP20 domain-containing protein [Tanacetum coccineum]
MDTTTATARRRVEMISGHFSAVADNISATAVATHVFPLNCSGGLSSINTRRDNSMHFARQDSRSQGFFMRPVSAEKDSIDQSNGSFRSTRSHKQASSELVTPLFSQPASINSNVPKVRNIHYVGDYDLPSLQPPKFSRTTTEKVVPMECRPDNNKHTTKHIGLEKKRSPRIEVAESRGKYLLQIELPGISISDIRVEVHNTTLTVQTTKGRTTAYSLSDHTSSSYYKRDVLEEPFEITWPLPFDVNPDSVSAEFLNLDEFIKVKVVNALRIALRFHLILQAADRHWSGDYIP